MSKIEEAKKAYAKAIEEDNKKKNNLKQEVENLVWPIIQAAIEERKQYCKFRIDSKYHDSLIIWLNENGFSFKCSARRSMSSELVFTVYGWAEYGKENEIDAIVKELNSVFKYFS